ncbi:MAG: alpha-2-macroglobulin family protein, partial [Rhodothermales bacterium]|nr:alpha-2-macroglobulin family protein [Rhodothermales bacterium]
TFDPVEGEVELGDSVRLTGTASAFSGAPVDGASVRYRVTRTPLFRPWQFRWSIRPPSADAEIASGQATTDPDGSFEISFVARPDNDIPRSYHPIFRYRVVVDVTDFAGETQTGTTNVRVGYTSLVLGLQTDENWDRDTLTELTITTENVEGSFVGTSGRVTVSRLDAPDRLLRDRVWPRVDRPLLNEEEHRELFPIDPYANETDPLTWPVKDVLLEKDFDTRELAQVSLEGIAQWPLGMYRVEAVAADGKGREVRAERLVTVFSTRGDRPPVQTLDWFVPLKTSGEPGETARLLLGSSAEDVRASVEVEKRGRVVDKRIIRLSNSQQILEFPIEEDDRGNFAVHISLVRHGRAFVRTQVITVPFTNKQLSLKLETFRDKLYPGQDEEWRLRITGSQGEPVAAELLAAMYDASLDQFVGHGWDLSLYASRWIRLGWTAQSEWGHEAASLNGVGWNRRFSARNRSYDRLNWFGLDRYFSFHSVRYMRSIQEGAVAELAVAMPAAKAGREDEMGVVANDALEPPDESGTPDETAGPAQAGPPRTNFNETAFFFPDLRTDENGEVSLVFTIPEALTRWRMLGLAHTTDLRIGQIEAATVTQKDLMITANAPRFFREGDRLGFAANVQNLSDTSLAGTARLELFEMETMRPLDAEFGNTDASSPFSLSAGRSQGLRWTIRVPVGVDAVVYRVTADAGNQSDGEQK